MLDRENEIYSRVRRALKENHGDIKVVGELQGNTQEFPTVFFYQESKSIHYSRFYGERKPENFICYFQAQVYTTGDNKKQEAKDIMDTISEVMLAYGFREIDNRPLANIDDTRIGRRVARWQGSVSKDYIVGGF